MVTDLERVATELQKAADYLDVFGKCESDKSSQREHVKKIYRRIARVVHPDSQPDPSNRALASDTFVLLNKYENQAFAAIDDGEYGEISGVDIKTKRYTHTVTDVFARGDLADLMFSKSRLKGVDEVERTVFKVTRSSRDNDLLIAEAKALKQLRRTGSDETLHPYVPKLIETLRVADGSKKRQANVISYLSGFYDLEQIHQAYPDGVNPLDMVWIWRRLLVAIGFTHEQQLVHGAVLPSHVMVLPEQHGLVLVDWVYSVSSEDESLLPIKAISPRYRDWYPKEVLDKQSPSNGTDIGMAAQTMVYLLGGNATTMQFPASTPKAFRAFFRGCVASNQNARPQNAWSLLKEFDELLESMGSPYYPRRFREFTMSRGTSRT